MARAGPEESHGDRFHGFLRAWGGAELLLDLCISQIYRHHNGREVDDQTPVTLERKLTFLKTAVATQESLTEFADVAMKAHRLLTDEKELRNLIVHGLPLKWERNGTVHFLRLEPNFESPRYRRRVVTPADWDRLDTAAISAAAHLAFLGAVIASVGSNPGLNLSQETFGEWFVKGAAAFPASKRLRQLFKELITRGS
jgi:hypothetical protein